MKLEDKFEAVLKKRVWIFFSLVLLGMIAVVFYDCIFGDWKLSYSNFLYQKPPFDSLGISTKGPWLSDVIDGILPSYYRAPFGIEWNGSNVFGYREVSLEFLDIKKLVFLIDLEIGQLLLYIFKYAIALSGMYLFLKKIGLGPLGAFIGGITFMFSSVMVVWGGWPHTDVTAYAPFLFFFVEDIFEYYRKEKKLYVNRIICFSVVLFFMLVTGMPTYVPFFLYTGVFYTLFRVFCQPEIRKDYKFIIVLFSGVAIAITLSVLMSFLYTGDTLISTAEYQESRRGAAFSTLDIKYLRTLIAPYFRDGLGMHINESTLFSGFVFLFAVPVCVFARKNSRGRELIQQSCFWGLILIVVTIFIFSKKSGAVYQFIPLLNTSSKVRIIVLFNFSASILSALVTELAVIQKPKINFLKSMLLYLIPIAIAIVIITRNYLTNKEIMRGLVIIIVITICFQFMLLNRCRMMSVFLLCAAVGISLSLFARTYLPLIPKEASVIPDATPSIEYLQQNTKNGERMGGVGGWVFFPNTNVFYNLYNISGHGFVNTQSDIKNYLTAADDQMYRSKTCTSLIEPDNENLLKWAAVKYLLYPTMSRAGASDSLSSLLKEHNTSRTAFPYYGNGSIVQSFTADRGFKGISILFSTYKNQLSFEDYINVSIENLDGDVVLTEKICLGNLKDNSFYQIQGNEVIEAGEYVFKISSDREFEKPLALWETGEDILGGKLFLPDKMSGGSLAFVVNYKFEGGMDFDDGCSVVEIADSAPRTYVADNIVVKENSDEVLEAMKSYYTANTAYVTKDYANQLINSPDSSNSDVLEWIDEGKTVTVRANGSRGNILVLNDYYTDGWSATVNGQPVDCIKVNYLFRGVVLPEDGEQTVQFTYQEKRDFMLIFVSVFGFILLMVVVVLRKRIEKMTGSFLSRESTE